MTVRFAFPFLVLLFCFPLVDMASLTIIELTLLRCIYQWLMWKIRYSLRLYTFWVIHVDRVDGACGRCLQLHNFRILTNYILSVSYFTFGIFQLPNFGTILLLFFCVGRHGESYHYRTDIVKMYLPVIDVENSLLIKVIYILSNSCRQSRRSMWKLSATAYVIQEV